MLKVLKWAGIVLLGLVVLVLIAGYAMISKGRTAFNQTYEVTANLLSDTPEDSLTLARGMHLASIHGCMDCHGDSFEGQTMIDAPPFLVTATNLTAGQGGIGTSYTTEDWDRAIRYGVRPDGTSLVIMPSRTMHNLSDGDAGALIAYLKSLTPVDNSLPETELRSIGLAMVGAGAFDPANEVHTVAERREIDTSVSIEAKGEYLSSITCTYCHGEDLRGGAPLDPSYPAPPDIVLTGAWPYDVFDKAMRTGESPNNPAINPEHMPWESFKHMTNEEMQALYMYLQSLNA